MKTENGLERAIDPFVSYRSETLRVLSQFECSGNYYGVTHYLEVWRGYNILKEEVWSEPETWLPSYMEEIIVYAVERTLEYQARWSQFCTLYPAVKEAKHPFNVVVFGVGNG